MAAAGGLIFLGVCLIIAALIVMSVRIYQVRPDFVVKILRYMLIGVFWMLFSAGSVAIGFRISERHESTYSRNYKSVSDIWGGTIDQNPPSLTYSVYEETETYNNTTNQYERRRTLVPHDIGFVSHKLNIKIDSNVRTKGLLKFPGYLLHFSGEYILRNSLDKQERLSFTFPLPSNAGNIMDIKVYLNGNPFTEDANLADGINYNIDMKPGEERTIKIDYKAQGTGSFSYLMGNMVREIKKLEANLETDFPDYDIPDHAMIPLDMNSDSKVSKITWKGENLVTGQSISLKFSLKDDYGHLASKLFFYAPLSLLLFMMVFILFVVSNEINLHPMHYLFLIGGFFVFYLLGSYMISFMNVILGIVLSLGISTGIMVYYMILLKKGKTLVQITANSAFIFQWVFSLAFFFPEYTGFLITVATIISFVALMRTTANTDWESKF